MRGVLYTNLIWICMLASCAGTGTVKTWVIGKEGLNENDTHEVMTFLQAQGYRCYSRTDDEFWRNQLATAKACCGKTGVVNADSDVWIQEAPDG